MVIFDLFDQLDPQIMSQLHLSALYRQTETCAGCVRCCPWWVGL